MSHNSECSTPSTFLRRCGAVWCCTCGELWTLGYATSLDFGMGLRTTKRWVRLSQVVAMNGVSDK